MNNPQPVVDAGPREAALDPTRSFAVIAPAGSGKTELLTKRVLTLLARVEQPEEILAITFTRKAAHEMRERILQALQGAEEEAPIEPHKLTLWQLARKVLVRDRQQEWRLQENPNRLRLMTIDSFCMSLVRQMPLLSGLGSDAAVTDQAESLYREAARNLLLRLDEDGPAGADLCALLGHLDNNSARVENLLCTMLDKREQWLRHLSTNRADLEGFKHYLESGLDCLIRETLEQGRALLMPWEQPLVEMLCFAAANLAQQEAPVPDLPTQELPGCTAADLDCWQNMVDLLLTKSGGWRARLTKNEGFPTATAAAEKARLSAAKEQALTLLGELAEHSEILVILQEVRSLPRARYDHQQWSILGRLSHLLPLLAAELILVFREQGVVDYQQITIAALEALGDTQAPSDIALLLDYRLKHILVDEFQDTSSAQFRLLSRLTEGWMPDDGRTFFIVGDGMQSCYGFRDANVGLFLAARQFGIGNAMLEPLDLQVNFRSQQGVVEWVNQVFHAAFPVQDDIARGAVHYSPSVAHNPATEGAPVSCFLCIDGDQQEEARQLVQRIKAQQRQTPADSIAVLVRNRTHLNQIIPHLHAEQIRWQGVDIEPLAKRGLISDLLALTRALLTPSDRTAWLAILRAPWCGLTLAELEAVAGLSHNHLSVWHAITAAPRQTGMSEQATGRLQGFIATIHAALEQRCRKPLRQWLEGIWMALGGPATAHSSDDLSQAEAFFELLAKHESGGVIADFEEFAKEVKRIYAKPRGDSAQPDNAVRIMTIHKAKGLEFDRVFVPGLDRTGQGSGSELMLWHERLSRSGEPQLLISPISAKGAQEDPLYRYLKKEQVVKERLENTRLIYVAATRAVKGLVLTACVKQAPDTQALLPPAADSLLACIWGQVKLQAIRLRPDATALETTPTAAAAISLTRPAAGWELPFLVQGNLLQPYRGHEYRDGPNLPPNPSHRDQEWINSTIRTLLLAIAKRGVERWDQQQIELSTIIERLCPAAIGAAARATVSDAVTQTLADPQGRWLLSEQHQRRLTDWRLSAGDPENLRSLSIPLALFSREQCLLVEFDMRTEEDALTASDPLVTLLSGYRDAVSRLVTEPVSVALYNPLLQRLTEL